jgi:hypothetical protein
MGDEHQIAFKSCLERSNCSEKGPGDPWLAPFFSTKSEAGDHWEVSAILHLGIPWKMGPFCMPFWHFEFEETPSPAEFMRTIHLGLAIDSVRWICWLRKGNTLSDRMLSSSGSSRRPARDAICICPQFCGDLRITKMPSRLRAVLVYGRGVSEICRNAATSRIITGFVAIRIVKHKGPTKILIN